MSDMRLIVAGAGGRMGRTLIQAITAADGAVVAGAVDAPGSAAIGRDAGSGSGAERSPAHSHTRGRRRGIRRGNRTTVTRLRHTRGRRRGIGRGNRTTVTRLRHAASLPR